MHLWLFACLMVLPYYGRTDDDVLIPDTDISGQNSLASKCPVLSGLDGSYFKLTPSSKYALYSPLEENEVGYNWDEASTKCMRVEMQIAEVMHLADLKSLALNLKVLPIWIGLNQRSQPGSWYHSSGGTAKFQTFVGMEPDNMNDERCVILKRKDDALVMEDVNCQSTKAAVLCQWPKDNMCYTESSEEAAYNSESMGFDAVGSSFYLSTVQKTWQDATHTCLESDLGLQLVALNKAETYVEMNDKIRRLLKEKGLHPGTQFWTAGSFEDLGTDYTLHFTYGKEGDISVKEDDIGIAHEWAPAGNNQKEPFDQSGTNQDQCLDISFEGVGSGGKAPYWRASNCHLPKYFICEKVDNTVPNKTVTDVTNEGGADEDSPDPTVVNCSASNSPLKYEVNLDVPETEEDVINFMMYSVENDLRSGNNPIEIREEIKWKQELIDTLFAIAKKVIPKGYVDQGMMNVVKFINLVYQNAAKSDNESIHENVWKKEYTPHFKKCLESIASQLKLKGNGFEVQVIELEGQDQQPTHVKIRVPEEHADRIETLDIAIDIFWYIFSMSFATCYQRPTSNELVYASDLHVQFVKDFIAPLRKRWTISVAQAIQGAKEKVDHTYILGDVDFQVNYRNIRLAVTAAYMNRDLDEVLQLVRPLDMTTIYSKEPMPFENGKTGNILY